MTREPGACPDEGTVVDIGGGKSYCIPWERWTNCREVGRCVLETIEESETRGQVHASLLDLLKEMEDVGR